MAGEWYRAVKVKAFVGIRLDDLRTALDASVYATILPILTAHTVREPLTVELRDLGYTNTNSTPFTVILDATAVQVDAGQNEIPRATCALAVGRDAKFLVAGVSDLAATSVVHVLERYLGKYVPVRIFESVISTSAAGMGDLGDNDWDLGEPKVLFYGFTTGPTRRGTAESSEFVLHASHFLAALTFSSSLSGDVAAGSDFAAPFHTSVLPQFMTGALPGMTPYGVVCAALAGGDAAQTDFWGFDVPSGATGQIRSCGLRSFLYGLANTNQFDWQAFQRADLGASRNCARPIGLSNNAALEALSRIEPFLPDWQNTAGGGAGPAHNFAATLWRQLASVVTSVRNGREAAGSQLGVDRSDIIAGAARAYGVAGYLYGVPLTFRLSGLNLGPFTPGRGFASDIAAATFGDLFPASFWELIAHRYASRYSFCLNPMASRATIAPNAPLLDGVWQYVYASEIFQWEDDCQTPTPVRGVILVSDRKSGTGGFAAGNPAVGAAAGAVQQMDSVYDSCEAGTFITRSIPAWLSDAYRLPSIYAANTMHNKPRGAVTVPWSVGAAAKTAIDVIVNNVPGANREAPMTPPLSSLTTGYRIAKALYQLERTTPRTAYIRGRYRTDIGPGSIVRFELPADKYVRRALGTGQDATMIGRVLRVTISIDYEREDASTSFAVGFTRNDAESIDPNNALYSGGHPYWSTISYGSPWCDSVYIRQKLADRANIVDQPLGGR
jgi:hypothetical protein